MAANFLLELDTTGPQIEIIAPTYTIREAENEIFIQGNEKLAPWHEVYFIDAADQRHDFIFRHDIDSFYGVVKFNQSAVGIGTLYATVRDEVYNISAQASAAIYVRSGAQVNVTISENARPVVTLEEARQIHLEEDSRSIAFSAVARRVITAENIREVRVSA